MDLLIWIYKIALHLYPKNHRIEFHQEMLHTTEDTLLNARDQGSGTAFISWLKEIGDIIPNAIQEHLGRVLKVEIQTDQIKEKPDWYFYLWWFLLLTIMGPITMLISGLIGEVASEIYGSKIVTAAGIESFTIDYVAGMVMFPILAITIGLTQYLLLRNYLPKMGWWLPVTVVPWVFMIWLYTSLLNWIMSVSPYDFGIIMAILGFGGIGLMLGFLQWLILRKVFRHAELWILMTTLGWILITISKDISPSIYAQFTMITLYPALFTGAGLWLLFFLTPDPLEQNT